MLAPHDTQHVLGHAHQGGALQVEAAIRAATRAHGDWAATPWEERAAVFLRAAGTSSADPGATRSTRPPCSGSRRRCTRPRSMQRPSCAPSSASTSPICPRSWRTSRSPPPAPGTGWSTARWRVSSSRSLRSTSRRSRATCRQRRPCSATPWSGSRPRLASLSAHYLMQLLRAAGLPDGVINLVQGPPAGLVQAAIADPRLAGIHFTGSTTVFQGIWSQVAGLPRYRDYPRLVGQTGGQGLHRRPRLGQGRQALATAICGGSSVPGVEVLGAVVAFSICSRCGPKLQRAPAGRVAVHQDRRCRRFSTSWGRHRRRAFSRHRDASGSPKHGAAPGTRWCGGRHRRRPRLVRGADGGPERRASTSRLMR